MLFNCRAFLSVFKIKFGVEIFYTTDSVCPIPRLLKGTFPGGGSLSKQDCYLDIMWQHHMTLHEAFRLEFLEKQKGKIVTHKRVT